MILFDGPFSKFISLILRIPNSPISPKSYDEFINDQRTEVILFMGPFSFKRPIIAITGSAGKTTTKEMIYSILKRQWKVFKSKENMNYYLATVKHKRRIRPFHQAVVLEYGILKFHDLTFHCRTIQPNIGVITNVGTAHIGNLGGSIMGIARAKSELIKGMNPQGMLFLNRDDINSKLLQKKNYKGKILTIGFQKGADYRAEAIQYGNGGMSFKVKLNRKKHSFFIPIWGKHNVYNALFAIAVAHQLAFSPKVIKDGLQLFKRTKRRLVVSQLGKRVKVIDDTYSANPDAMKASIDVLCKIGTNTKMVCLGSMLEMGTYTVKAHQEVGRYLASKKVDFIYTFGKDAKHIGIAARNAGFPKERIKHFRQRNRLHQHLLKNIGAGATLLVKGSNGMKMNKTVTFLKRNL